MPLVNNNSDLQSSTTFQDMDIFYYKQIALNLQDHDLHKKIDHEIKMRDGSMKLLAASKHTNQQLEAAKTLHASNCRMMAYMEDLQQRKCSTAASEYERGNMFPCKAKVALSEIRIPLMWKDSDHFKNKGNYRRFTVFCIVRIGTEVYDTGLISEVDRLMTDVSFDDVIVLNNIPHDFECRLEVYTFEHSEDLTIASAQIKLKKKINDISNTVGRRLSGLSAKEPFDPQALLGPKFELVAHAAMKLSDACDRVSTHDLIINSDIDTANALPMFGSVCCRFVVQPHCLVNEAISGFLYVKEKGAWQYYWCSLQNLKISCWNSQFEADTRDPLTLIPVSKDCIISDIDPSQSDRPCMFQVHDRMHDDAIWQLAAENGESLAMWWEGLEQHLLDQVVWKHACDAVMQIPDNSKPTSPYFLRNQRAGSLYDRTKSKRGLRPLLHQASLQEGSPLTLAFNRFTQDSDTRNQVSRNNSFPK